MEVSKLGVNKWGRARRNRIQMILKEDEEKILIDHINDKMDINAYIKQLILDDIFKEQTAAPAVQVVAPAPIQTETVVQESNLVTDVPEIDDDQMSKIKEMMGF